MRTGSVSVLLVPPPVPTPRKLRRPRGRHRLGPQQGLSAHLILTVADHHFTRYPLTLVTTHLSDDLGMLPDTCHAAKAAECAQGDNCAVTASTARQHKIGTTLGHWEPPRSSSSGFRQPRVRRSWMRRAMWPSLSDSNSTDSTKWGLQCGPAMFGKRHPRCGAQVRQQAGWTVASVPSLCLWRSDLTTAAAVLTPVLFRS
jgi:hypothetical protein